MVCVDRMLAIVVCAVLAVSCGRKPDPGRYTIELRQVQISPHDFNLNAFGDPFNLRVAIQHNEREVPTYDGNNTLSGSRGERSLEAPVKWDVVYEPSSRYVITVEEQAIISDAVRWSIPATPRMGDWPFGVGTTQVTFGRDSYLEFNTYRR